MQTKLVEIDLGERSYKIAIGMNLLRSIHEYLPFDVAGKKIFLITDDNVEPYARVLQETLTKAGAGFCEVLVFPHGEKTKSYERLQEAHNWMLEHNVHRNSIVFAVGGGVIGDLAGFSASTVLRGVSYVQIPTSLLAQVDSSVGGKTGINTQYGKNLVGNFYQPVCVIADIDVFKTLPQRELRAGYAEVVKYGLIDNLEFFEWLDVHGSSIIDGDVENIAYAVEVSCKAKAAIVEADEREHGKRALLNLGHTFGHALEAAAGYDGTLLHGEGVAIGMVMAFDLSVAMGLCQKADALRIRQHLLKIGLPVDAGHIGISASVDDLIAIMQRDKKAIDNKMTFILVRAIGDAFVTQDVPEKMVRDVLDKSLKEQG
ncbi:MAG: 3-dehydroquinate synthase [Zetaproteobacteria bacterium]|nr:MAG: 3-dehydroquinate synthase [Zetaproteobacteria bacterium]